MPVVVSFLRGINIAGRHLIKMEDLRAVYEAIGLTPVQSYIQSGNLVAKTHARDLPKLENKIAGAIEARYGFRPSIMLRTLDEFRRAVRNNPFAQQSSREPNKMVLTFLGIPPTPEARTKASAIVVHPEELFLGQRELYVYYPNGIGNSKFPMAALERALGTTGTSRNWTSVTKVLAMAEEMASS